MACSESHSEYIKDEEKLDSPGSLTPFDSSCSLASNNHHAIDSKSICKKFQYLHQLLSTKVGSSPQQLDDNDYDFMNFWLNHALNNFRYNDPGIVEKIFGDIFVNGTKVKTYSQLQSKICYINDDIYNNMDIVFTLFYNYNKIYKSENEIKCDNPLCELYAKQSLEKYKQGIFQCPENDGKFCQQIYAIKTKYEASKDATSTNVLTIPELKVLPTYAEVVEEFKLIEMKKNIFIGVISTLAAVLGLVIYLFYAKKINPNGKSFRDKKNKKREIKDNINQEAHQMLYKSEENKINVNSKQYNILYNS